MAGATEKGRPRNRDMKLTDLKIGRPKREAQERPTWVE